MIYNNYYNGNSTYTTTYNNNSGTGDDYWYEYRVWHTINDYQPFTRKKCKKPSVAKTLHPWEMKFKTNKRGIKRK